MSTTFSRDWFADACMGNIPGASCVHKFGRNAAVPNGSWEFVTLLGQTGHVLSAATAVRIKSGGDAADTAAGNGAREITVQGIDDSFNEISVTIATNGASASTATTELFWRVHRAWVSSCGTYGAANTAAITIENGTGGTDIMQMGIEEGQSQDCVWSVPTGKTAYLVSLNINVDASKPADIRLFTRNDLDDTTAPMKSKRLKKYFDGVQGPFTYKPRGINTSILGKGDIWVEAQGSGAGTEVSVDMEILVIDD